MLLIEAALDFNAALKRAACDECQAVLLEVNLVR